MLRKAIVLDGHQRSALATVRSLGAHGVEVTVAEKSVANLAASSRYCKSVLTYPDPQTQTGAFLSWLSEIDRTHAGSVLLPMTDVTVPLVLQAQPAIKNLQTALPSLHAYREVSDKYRLFELAKVAGIRVPRTVSVTTASFRSDDFAAWRFPIVVKPRQSARQTGSEVVKRSVTYANSLADLQAQIVTRALDDTDEFLLQEYVRGFGAGVFALYNQGSAVTFFAHRRIREKPPSGGISVLCESTGLDERMVDAIRQILEPLRWHGVAMMEFKVEPDGTPWLIEINARFWGSLQLAIDSGVDFPALLFGIARGEGLSPPSSYKTGQRLRWFLGDLDNLYASLTHSHYTPTARAKAAALLQFAAFWQPNMRYEFFRPGDLRPALFALREYFSQFRRA